MLPSDYACPRCECRACYALHRKGFNWILSLFGLRPARCLTCSRKFYTRYSVGGDGKFIPSHDSEEKADREFDRAA